MTILRIDDAPGLRLRARKTGYVAYWIARDDLVAKGYPDKTARLWAGIEPSEAERRMIQDRCAELQAKMLAWSSGDGAMPAFDGTMKALIDTYQRDQDSPYSRLRPDTRASYDYILAVLTRNVGVRRIETLTGRDFVRWHKQYLKPTAASGGPRVRWAHGVMVMLRILFGYGAAMDLPPVARAQCAGLRKVLAELRFESPRPRTSRLTADQAVAIRAKAHELGKPSIALAQAFAFELTLRQRDVIGEWVKVGEPGLSSITDRGQKWLRGIRWEEISADLVLEHETSKTGQKAAFNLRLYPMIMEEIARMPARPLKGPVVVAEATGLPYRRRFFALTWRDVATAAGVPLDVWQMDSRAGGVTEATDAGAAIEDVRHHAQHANASTTMLYSRQTLDKTSKVAVLRVEFREKPKK